MSAAWMQTWSGKRFYPLEPRVEDIDIVDIARALSIQSRYAGHLPFPYSVAQHSLLVSAIVERELRGKGVEVEVDWNDTALKPFAVGVSLPLAALLHDAAEAYLTDLVRPIKDNTLLGAEYKDVERGVEAAIETRFGLPAGILNHPVVKRADEVALATEARDLGLLAKAPAPWTLRAESLAAGERVIVSGHDTDGTAAVQMLVAPVHELGWRSVEDMFLRRFDELGGVR